MIGIEVEVETIVFYNSNSVCIDSSITESKIKNRANFIEYHLIYWE